METLTKELPIKNWTFFFFQGNLAWGLITSPKEWKRIREIYIGEIGLEDLKKARQDDYSSDNSFGYASYCNGITLGEFAEQNGMEL